jgi:hypothetical protein
MRELKIGNQIKRPDTPLANTPKPTWEQMSPSERKSKQIEIKSTRGREGFVKYMDSVVAKGFEKGAEKRGISVEKYRKKQTKDSKKQDANQPNIGPSSSKGGAKSPCKGGICPGLNTES